MTNITKVTHFFAGEMYSTMCRMERWSLWSWYDLDWSYFDEDAQRRFLANRTNGRAIATLLRLSSVVVCRLW